MSRVSLGKSGLSTPVLITIIVIGAVVASSVTYFALPSFRNNKTNEDIGDNQLEENSNTGSETKVGTNVGDKATNFSVNTLENNKFTLDNYQGKAVLVNFMTTECPYCKLQVDDIKEIVSTYSENLKIISIGVNPQESEGDIQEFKDEEGANWTFASGPKIGFTYKIRGVPTNFLINQKRIITFKGAGYVSSEKLSSEIKDVL